MDKDSMKVWRDVLASFDKNGDGYLQTPELRDCLFNLGCATTAEQLESIKKYFDENNDGKIQIDELLKGIDVIMNYSIKEGDLLESFQKIDTGKDGYIREHELIKILTMPGPDQVDRQEAEDFIDYLKQEYDADKDGKISYAEFIRLMHGEGWSKLEDIKDNSKRVDEDALQDDQ